MTILGLTGGIASGKSFVAALLAERGAVVLDADRHAHAVLAEPAVRDALVDRWGAGVLAEDGSLRRGEIARRVFGDDAAATAERRFLENLVHPRVRQRLRAELDRIAGGGAAGQGVAVAVLDIPLLIEAGWADECDAVLFVDTPLAVRQQRAATRGWSADELARREASQTPIDAKRAAADVVVPGADEAAAREVVDRVWRRWGLPDAR
ncbi:Dephospho-CoA kinase [Botrimarina colliarenosi]|uniref:Dephospho-CoA kinase n=1 Tax=Botrimarina colliarenosi TaxID=2528001 RepID=A0A5C6A2B3_9BACT|nr:dephospho-CoA kinase [Botrimarina colliarenosi]TWT93371.1 Dephospho-CoA kinase [Botrimarina colliarenosi]